MVVFAVSMRETLRSTSRAVDNLSPVRRSAARRRRSSLASCRPRIEGVGRSAIGRYATRRYAWLQTCEQIFLNLCVKYCTPICIRALYSQ